MQISSNTTPFCASFYSEPANGKECLRKIYDSHITSLEEAKYSALKTYDIMTKNPQIKAKLERMPANDEVVLNANISSVADIDLETNAPKAKKPLLVYFSNNKSTNPLKNISVLEINEQNPKEIEQKINSWLDGIMA